MWVCRLPVHFGPRSVHRFYDNLRRICSFPTGRCRHRPLHSSRRLHLLFTIFRAEQARQGEAYHHTVHKNPLSAKAVTEVTLMANDETFRYDPTPMNHEFPGQPDDCFDMVNQYGTYNIQKTADTDNAYPAIAQGMPKVGHFARRSKAMFDLAGGEKKK